jgi:glycosyltransferase involved in cell wall biosynthesis
MARALRADVVHAHTEIPGVTAVRVAADLGLPSVVTIHGINTDSRLNAPRQRACYREHLSRASRIVLVGEPLRDHVAAIVGRSDHFRIVHNGFRPPGDDVAQADWTRPLRLVSVSNLHEGKGIDLTLAALRRLEDSGVADWTYNVVGGGNQAVALRQLARDLGLSAKVTFSGPCDHDEVYRHLARANVFVLPSYVEAFGIAYLEAMSLGLLAIGVRGQGPSGFIREGENGFLVEPRSADSLHACFLRVGNDMPGMRKIAARGRDHVRRNLTWRSHAEHLTAVFAEVV